MCFFDDISINSTTKDNIFKNAARSNTLYVKNLLFTNNINVNDSNLVDDYNQTLLHIATKTKNYNLATYLIDNGANITKKDSFNESSFDIAMKNYDAKMVGILLGQEKTNSYNNTTTKLKESVKGLEELNKKYSTENVTLITNNTNLTAENKSLNTKNVTLTTENKSLNTKNVALTTENKSLNTKNVALTTQNKSLNAENDKLHTQLEEERKTLKRKFDGFSEYERENKKLKVEVTQLKSDNNVLQQTVKLLRDANKK